MDYHSKALELYGDLIEELSDEEIAEISLELYDITGIDLSEIVVEELDLEDIETDGQIH